jgi:hypothetical protein
MGITRVKSLVEVEALNNRFLHLIIQEKLDKIHPVRFPFSPDHR